jgi:hypothetical protein
MLTTKQKLDYISSKICSGETKKKPHLLGPIEKDKSLLKYDDMKLPHRKIIDEHSAINPSSQNVEREKEKSQKKKTPFWRLAT